MNTLDRFYEQVRNIQSYKKSFEHESRSEDESIQFIIETSYEKSHLAESLQRYDSLTTIETLFRHENDEDEDPSLRHFYIYRIDSVKEQEVDTSLYDVAYALWQDNGFTSVEPDLHFKFIDQDSVDASLMPNNNKDYGWALQAMNMDKAWKTNPSHGRFNDGQGISIAHLDTGWTEHVDLDKSNFDEKKFTDLINSVGGAKDPLNYGWNEGHGTKTGSVMMSKGGLINGDETTPPGKITGVASSCDYIAVRCIKKVWFIRASHIARAIHAAAQLKVDVISMSLGGLMLRAMNKAVKNAARKQIILCAAAGNHVKFVVYPARYKHTIGVAASNRQNLPWSGSSRGKRVDITAPGEAVWHALPGPNDEEVNEGSGTSYGTAHLAGVAAVWLSFFGKKDLLKIANNSGIKLQELFRQCLQTSADDQNGNWNKKKYGAGIVDVAELLNTPPKSVNHTPIAKFKDIDVRLIKFLNAQFKKLNIGHEIRQLSGYRNEINNIMLMNPSKNSKLESLEKQDSKTLAKSFYYIFKYKLSKTLKSKFKLALNLS